MPTICPNCLQVHDTTSCLFLPFPQPAQPEPIKPPTFMVGDADDQLVQVNFTRGMVGESLAQTYLREIRDELRAIRALLERDGARSG